MNPDLVRYLSSVMRGEADNHSIIHLSDSQPSGDLQYQDLVKDRFLVDSTFSLGLDEVI